MAARAGIISVKFKNKLSRTLKCTWPEAVLGNGSKVPEKESD